MQLTAAMLCPAEIIKFLEAFRLHATISRPIRFIDDVEHVAEIC